MDESKRKNKKDKDRSIKKKKRRRSSTDSSSSSSDNWVERVEKKPNVSNRDDWMSMGGTLKTFTKDDIKPKRDSNDKKHIDSYNPATSTRELNPYWKNGGSGVPLTSEQYRKSNMFMKPTDDDTYYSRTSSKLSSLKHIRSSNDSKRKEDDDNRRDDKYGKSYNWRKSDELKNKIPIHNEHNDKVKLECNNLKTNTNNSMYLSDEKMNKLAAKIVKAEIMGDIKLVEELKLKLQAAKDFRKQNPNYETEQKVKDKEAVLLIRTTASGSSQPILDYGDKIDKKGKIKTHNSSGRVNYYANEDNYDISRMFEQEKYGSNHKNDMQLVNAAASCKTSDNLEDLFEEQISQNKRAAKDDKLEEKYAVRQNLRLEKSEEYCNYCLESKNMLKHLMISCGDKVYLALPSKRSLVEGHCIITTINHHPCVTSVDEDIWEEILLYRNMVTQYFNKQDKDVLFFETAIKLFKFPHMIINCVPLPRDVGDMASIYFKKALLECETEWSMNKKVIELKGKSIRKGVPKGLPYFWVDFGMDPGFAHVVEDQRDFPVTFAQQIISGMLDLDHRLWKNPQNEIGEVQRKKVVDFLRGWKPFEDSFKSDRKSDLLVYK